MRCRTTSALGITLLCTVWAGTAAAQPNASLGAPVFMTMDRGDGESRVGGQLGWTFFDDDGGDVTGLRFDVYGQYVAPSGLGGYGVLPISMLFFDTVAGDESETAIGNVELGALYVIGGETADFVLRGGITLPTADDELEGQIANVFAVFPRLTDLAHAVPEGMALRLSASPILRSGQLILRADAGMDVFLAAEGPDEPDPFLRLNVGGGIDTGTVAVLAELVNIGNLEELDGEDDFAHTAAISARFRAGSVEPGIAIGFPLDDALEDAIDFFIAAGIHGVL
ncbi:MAG TPA: hypothetical protein VKZ63_13900 [Kofleriaceae bacterium]|nr:hypothetical protein [Kofleriaceae bacterium]